MADIKVRKEAFPIGGHFSISRGSRTVAEVIVIELLEDGYIGRGESTPYPRFNENCDGVIKQIQSIATISCNPEGHEELAQSLSPGAARNALDCALWDLRAKRSGKPVWQLAQLPEPTTLTTAFTISIDSIEKMAAKAKREAHRPILKIKLGGEDRKNDGERIKAVRAAAPKARLLIDANEGWSIDLLAEYAPLAAELDYKLIEQPLPAEKDQELEGFVSPIPIGADESFHTSDQIAKLKDRYDMFNIKLDKTGGLSEAIKCVEEARTHGLDFMVGCMLGTSLAMAPAILVASNATYVDLDAPLLLAHDRVPGLKYNESQIEADLRGIWGETSVR